MIASLALANAPTLAKVGQNRYDYTINVKLNNTGSVLTMPLYFGKPIQFNETSTFIIDTTFSSLLVQTHGCGNKCNFPVYEINDS